jgi:hypothetical protein
MITVSAFGMDHLGAASIVPFAGSAAAPEHDLPLVPDQSEPLDLPSLPPPPPAPKSESKKKRGYHSYSQPVIDFYFSFEKLTGLPRYTTVQIVKADYPSLFPSTFHESRVRSWEDKNKKSEDKAGPGKGWRKGKTVIPTELLVFLGTLVMGQYAPPEESNMFTFW